MQTEMKSDETFHITSSRILKRDMLQYSKIILVDDENDS